MKRKHILPPVAFLSALGVHYVCVTGRKAANGGCQETCCGKEAAGPAGAPWVDGRVRTPVGEVPRVATVLRAADRAGAWKARWGIGRMSYRVGPGLYAVGDPTPRSPVLVTANYKMSFDGLRSRLRGRDAWIMVLDTRGINVWCAAGKGTFGTDELVHRAAAVRLAEVVDHRTLILPQLGAPGVSAHQVRRRSGFRVAYGPVRAEDVPAFLDAGMKATPEMRRVTFPFADRVALTPVELVTSARYALLAAACLFLLSGLGPGVYSAHRAAAVGLRQAALLLGAWLAAVVLTPALLPWLPGRAFSVKGVWIGLGLLAAVGGHVWAGGQVFANWADAAAWVPAIPAVTSFTAMNFTGATPFTSLSGVRKEMRVAVPLQAGCAALGMALWLLGRFM